MIGLEDFGTKKINFITRLKQGCKTMVADLGSLPLVIKVILSFLTMLVIWNSFFDLNHFLQPGKFVSNWTFINDYDLPWWQQVCLMLNPIATIANILCLLLIAYGKISNFFWGVIGFTTYGFYALGWNYVGDMQLNLLFFLPLQFVAYYSWKSHFSKNQTIIINKLNPLKITMIVYGVVLVAFFFFFEIPEFSKTFLGSYPFEGDRVDQLIPHGLDATTDSVSIIAQVLMLMRYRSQWIFWIFNDIIQFSMYSGLNYGNININMLIMWSFMFLNSCIGMYNWYKKETPIEETEKLPLRRITRYYYEDLS